MEHLDVLTLEQKARLLSGRGLWHTQAAPEAGVPEIVLADGPHGVRLQEDENATDIMGINASRPATCFPTAAAVGSSWDVEVAARLGAAVGREARGQGVAVLLGPGVNIKRSPLCGRNFEYYSEDPLLSGMLGAAQVEGLRAEGVLASVKHFAANNQETDRAVISADVDERTLREIYLPAFEHIVTRARPATVMTSFNKVNGVHTAEHHWLLTEVLRAEWGFDGVVVSDWGGVHDRVAALLAGLDLQMPGDPAADAAVADAVRRGELDEAVVDRSARRVIDLALAATEGAAEVEGAPEVDADAQHALARLLAADCAVLLKNDGGVLPLTGDTATIAVIGEFATAPRFQGGGSSHVNPTRVDEPLAEIRAAAAAVGVEVTHAAGFDDGAVAVAGAAGVAVVFAGLAERYESEAYDRRTMLLPSDQVALIRAVAAVARCTVVVLANGGAVSLEGWHDDVDAVLEGWLLGQAGGGAIADLLFGVVNPSGRLAETLPLRLEDNPSHLNFPGEFGHVRYGEGVLVGYRYYQSLDVPVRYPFGHGLSYTEFRVTDLAVTMDGDDAATVRAAVTNVGLRAGKHVVQVYVETAAGPVRRPRRELRAFRKVALEPGCSAEVTFRLDRRAFAYYNLDRADWAVAAGEYAVQIGANAADIVAEQRVILPGDLVPLRLTRDSPVGEWLAHPVAGPALVETLVALMPEEQRAEAAAGIEMLHLVSALPLGVILDGGPLDVPPEVVADLVALTDRAPVRV